MKNLLLIAICAFTVVSARAQLTDFVPDKTVKKVNATVKAMASGESFVIVPDDNNSGRYITAQLPQEYKKDGLKITFSGVVGKIPPNVRMMGTPLKLTSVCVSKAERKKYRITKAKYTFK
ncbi:MAG: hypothetical protein U0V74_09540 [Chitinophagales bacterium]